MKTSLTFILSLCISALSAQITITNADMPSVNDTFRFSITGNIGLNDPELTGPNYTWDYSSLIFVSQRVDTFVSVSSTPFAYQFYFNNQILYPDHKASYALRGNNFQLGQMQVEDVYDFYKNDPADYKHVGFGARINGVPSSVRYNPRDFVYRFPLDFGNIDSSTSVYGFTIPTIGFYGQTKKRVNEVDGWGTLTTPFGTFQTLRIKSTLYIQDTIYIDSLGTGSTIPRPTQVEYKWLGSGEGVPLLQVNAELTLLGPLVTTIIYRDSLRAVIGMEEEGKQKPVLTVYPNPTSGQFTVSSRQGAIKKVEVYDLFGRMILRTNIPEIDMSSFPSGIYFVKVGEVVRKLMKK